LDDAEPRIAVALALARAHEAPMIIGHLGVALGAKSMKRDGSLLWMVVAAYAPDFVDICLGTFLKLCTQNGEWSHSLPAAGVLASLLGLGCLLWTGDRALALVVAALVVVHVPPDYLTGHKVLWPGGPAVGLRLYQFPVVDFLLELPLIVAGWWLVRRARVEPRWVGGWWALGALILAQAAGNNSHGHYQSLKPGVCPAAVSAEREGGRSTSWPTVGFASSASPSPVFLAVGLDPVPVFPALGNRPSAGFSYPD
jgi:membrane-bound metal-dependent hydrolase YbcI (DUF457 family)